MFVDGVFFFLTYQEGKFLFAPLRVYHQSIQTDITYSIFAINIDSLDNTDSL